MSRRPKTSAAKLPKTPWQIAFVDDRDYLTPEDVGHSMESGCEKLVVWRDLLDAIEREAVEDASCAAFVALQGSKRP